MNQHSTLTPSTWQQTSIIFQLANIGSEIERTILWKNKGNSDYSQKAFDRALELISLSMSAPLTYSQYKEFARVRELLIDWQTGANEWHSTDDMWQKYFYAFTYAAQNQKKYPAP